MGSKPSRPMEKKPLTTNVKKKGRVGFVSERSFLYSNGELPMGPLLLCVRSVIHFSMPTAR